MKGTLYQRDLFGAVVNKAGPTRVRLYADEVKEFSNKAGENWMYIGLVAIPENLIAKALDYLNEDRTDADYKEEAHFKELKNTYRSCYGAKTLLAKKWFERVLYDAEKIFHFHFLGINMSNIQPRAFGAGVSSNRSYESRIYNRFFRAAVSYALKRFFGKAEVTAVFHDRGDMEHDDLFDWHVIWSLGNLDDDIVCLTNQVKFISSDHKKEERFPNDSHIIQLCDVLTGIFRQCLDAPNEKQGCNAIARLAVPLLQRLTDEKRANNTNSRYNYYRRIDLSFFPSRKLSTKQLNDRWERLQSSFYIDRRLLIDSGGSTQLNLF